MLLVPLCLMIEEEVEEGRQKKETKKVSKIYLSLCEIFLTKLSVSSSCFKSNIGGILATVLHFSFFLAALLWVSYKIMGKTIIDLPHAIDIFFNYFYKTLRRQLVFPGGHLRLRAVRP